MTLICKAVLYISKDITQHSIINKCEVAENASLDLFNVFKEMLDESDH